MTQFSFFEPTPQEKLQQAVDGAGTEAREKLRFQLQHWAAKKVYWGTSSWKYAAWAQPGPAQLYQKAYRSKKEFEDTCLQEYGSVLHAVGADYTFYNWPSTEQIDNMIHQLPPGFKVAFKATEWMLHRHFPNISAYKEKAGMPNPDFLNGKLFRENFLDRIAPLRDRANLAPLIVEFTALPKNSTFLSLPLRDQFCDELEGFFKKHPPGFEYGIEMRNEEFCNGHFFARLMEMNSKGLRVAPILNAWTRMPDLEAQLDIFSQFDFPFLFCRALMRKGRTRDEAVRMFEPYDRLQERQPHIRNVMARMVQWGLTQNKPVYLICNNHLEGCSYLTIVEMLEELGSLVV